MGLGYHRLITRALLGAAAVVTLCLAVVAHATGASDRISGVALVNPRGFSLNTYPRAGTLARVGVRFASGFAITLRPSSARRTFGYYSVNSDQGELFGWFLVPRGSLGRHVKLAPLRNTKLQTQSTATLQAVITLGVRPAMVITGFPPGATKLEFDTSGAGTAASRITSQCVNHRKLVRGTMRITTRGGQVLPGTVAPGVLCGVGTLVGTPLQATAEERSPASRPDARSPAGSPARRAMTTP